MNMLSSRNVIQDQTFLGSIVVPIQGTVALVSDDPATAAKLQPVCEFLDLKLEVVSAEMDLLQILHELRPMAVIADVDGPVRDGFDAMKEMARYNRELPILLLTGGDPIMMGAADAVQELCGLTTVTSTSEFPVAGQLVAFLFSAGRRAGCMRLLQI
jgi:CheY-like chemotaxis protein